MRQEPQLRIAWQQEAHALRQVQVCRHGGCQDPEVPMRQDSHFRSAWQQEGHALRQVQVCRQDGGFAAPVVYRGSSTTAAQGFFDVRRLFTIEPCCVNEIVVFPEALALLPWLGVVEHQ